MVSRLGRDVSQWAQGARQMRDGQLDTRAPRAGTALVRPLANAFNHMADQLQPLLESQRVLAQALHVGDRIGHGPALAGIRALRDGVTGGQQCCGAVVGGHRWPARPGATALPAVRH
ncbi:hypothetical protein G6F64_014708 [Rhizopus arrhizus]|uniref:HAMP domain-containing protein n=1 Tax=Rhizopus oryzae TaxID=64495 RepID=A0A9P6WTI8_RHIOR|nr:hypothetical protein G6F64_014708 [Rhizopus arrhizus]